MRSRARQGAGRRQSGESSARFGSLSLYAEAVPTLAEAGALRSQM